MVDPGEVRGHPSVATDVGGRPERLGVEVDQFGLGRRAGLDRDRIAPLPADGEDLLSEAERDIDLPGQDLLGLGQGQRDRADVVEGRHLARSGGQLGWLSIWARWRRPEKST